MRVALGAHHFGAFHEEAVVVGGLDRVLVRRLIEARPAGARFEFGAGIEQRLAAADADIGTGRVRVPIFAGEGALGAFLARDAVLLGRELRLPFGVGLARRLARLAGCVAHGRLAYCWFNRIFGAQLRPPPVAQVCCRFQSLNENSSCDARSTAITAATMAKSAFVFIAS